MKNYEQNPKIKGLWYAIFIYIRTLFIRTSRLRLPEIQEHCVDFISFFEPQMKSRRYKIMCNESKEI